MISEIMAEESQNPIHVVLLRLTYHIWRRIYTYTFGREPGMRTPRRLNPKNQALARDGVLNPHPDAVRDPLFRASQFFDPRDLVQVRYEMVRRHDADGLPVSDAAALFGVSRPTFYKAQSTLATSGLAGLVPLPRGPKQGHKLSAKVVDFVDALKAEQPELTTSQCLTAIEAEFGIKVHRRSLERALARKKKLHGQAS